jgi:hypothetical protein
MRLVFCTMLWHVALSDGQFLLMTVTKMSLFAVYQILLWEELSGLCIGCGGQGRRRDLMSGGLYRSMGGWRAVADLRRGSEAYRSDERVLGSSEFVEALLEEADAQSKGRYR